MGITSFRDGDAPATRLCDDRGKIRLAGDFEANRAAGRPVAGGEDDRDPSPRTGEIGGRGFARDHVEAHDVLVVGNLSVQVRRLKDGVTNPAHACHPAASALLPAVFSRALPGDAPYALL